MSLIAALEALVESGATPEMMLAVARKMEAAREAELAERRAKDAARKRKPSVDSTEFHGIPRNAEESAKPSPHVGERPQVVTPSLPSLRSEEVRIPPEKPTVSTPKGAKTRILKSRMCPADWSPSDEDRAVGMAEGFTSGEIERELSKFRDHEFRDPHSHWSPTFRKWLRTAAERKPRKAHERSHPDQRATAYAERLGDIGAAMEAALQQHRGSG